MKVFVTGATGFVGGHLVKRLASDGHEIRCLVRKGSRSGPLQELGAELVLGDVTDKESVRSGIKGCDWVANLANVYTLWEPDKKIYRLVNVDGTRNVLECALEEGVSKLAHVSTLATFGNPTERPFNEDSQMGARRFSEYAESKYAGDLIAWEFANRGLPLVMIYPGVVLGPSDPKTSGRFIQDLVNRKIPVRVFNKQVFTYVYVGDVADGIVRALAKQNNVGEKYLIGKESMSFEEVYEMVCDIAGVHPPRMTMPNAATMALATVLTAFSRLTKKPPWLGLSTDQVRTMSHGCEFDGSKAERDLGLRYTPIRQAVVEAVESLCGRQNIAG